MRTLLIQFDSQLLPLRDLLTLLEEAEADLPDPAKMVVKSRVFHLPLAFRDQWSLEAIARYQREVRAVAPYCPDNVEFVAANNGLKSAQDVKDIVMSASYCVLGLGDVYLGKLAGSTG